MTTPRQKQKNKNKGPARHPPANAVFEARRHAVNLTKERDKAVEALRHSNAVAVYLLGLLDGSARIPLADYKLLLADDGTTVSIAYEGEEAVVKAVPPAPKPVGGGLYDALPPARSAAPTSATTPTHVGETIHVGDTRARCSRCHCLDHVGPCPALSCNCIAEQPTWECLHCGTINIPARLTKCDCCGDPKPLHTAAPVGAP